MKVFHRERFALYGMEVKRQGIQFYSHWVPLNSVCADNVEQINATRQDLYKYITENILCAC